MSGFKPCGECNRHVRIGDATCPFCGAAQERGAPLPPRRVVGRRIARAAVMVATAVSPVACDTTSSLDDASLVAPDAGTPGRDAEPADMGPTDAEPADMGLTDAEPADMGPTDAEPADMGAPDQGFIAGDVYGVPPDSGADAGEAGVPDMGFIPGDAYGAPPQDGGP